MDNTKQKILDAATDIFVSQGFAGASISKIATQAGIHQSLIYHHIGNKEELWKAVKRHLLLDTDNAKEDYDNLDHFISYILTQRVKLYENDPRILRLIQWQALENQSELIGGNHSAPVEWIKVIEVMQERGQIKKGYSSDLITVYIHSLINGLLLDMLSIFTKTPEKKKEYIEMIKKEILSTFQPKNL